MGKISDVVKLKSGYANFVELKSAFEATQENADRMAMYRPTKAHRLAFERICRGLYQPNPRGNKRPGSFPRILIDRFEAETLYLTTYPNESSVYVSTNGGARWNQMPTRLVLPDGRPHHWHQFQGGLAIAQAIDGRLFATGGWRYDALAGSAGRYSWVTFSKRPLPRFRNNAP